MPSYHPNKPEVAVTPRECFQLIQFGTGKSFKYREFFAHLRQLGERGPAIVQQTRDDFIQLVGFEPGQLLAIAPEGTFPTSEGYEALRDQIRSKIVDNLAFLKNYDKEHREAGLRRMGTEANNYLNRLIAYHFPGEETVEMNSEVEICNDAASLVMLAFNDNVNPKVKFEAARKLLLMKYVGEIRNYSKHDEDNDEALHYMMGIFNERVLELSEGTRIGSTTPRYMISRHDPVDFQTKKTEIRDVKPTDINETVPTQVTKLPCRKTIVIGKDGKEREIFFTLDPREKGDESRLTKTLRYGCQIGERDVDRNGLRLVFENREDWDDFFEMFKEEIKVEVRESLCDRLEEDISPEETSFIQKRLDNLHECIDIADEKDTLNGEEFNGSAPSSSKELKIHKFKLAVTRANGRKHHYEFQIFLPDGYADAKYRKSVSWEEYRADRFFREGVDRLLFPESTYSELDRKAAYERVMRRSHENLWSKWLNSGSSAKQQQKDEDHKKQDPDPKSGSGLISKYLHKLASWLKRK